jgi:dTMP kinase
MNFDSKGTFFGAMNFISIEGLDGAGKSTQIKMLEDYLRSHDRSVKRIHFPRTEDGIFGEMIACYLRGEYGTICGVNPYLTALLYAQDRRAAAPTIDAWLKQGCIVIADRYVHSNIAYQCAKIADTTDQNALRDWIFKLEYEEFAIPKPQKSIFLDAPSSFTQGVLAQQRQGSERQYLHGMQDIHEADAAYQQRVRSMYLRQTAWDKDFSIVKCMDSNGAMQSKEAVFDSIVQFLYPPIK